MDKHIIGKNAGETLALIYQQCSVMESSYLTI